MKNSDYWRRRAQILEAAKNQSAGKYTAEVERQFNLAQKTLDEQIEGWYGRFAKNNQISLAEARQWMTSKDLAEFKWDVSEYIRHGKEVSMNPTFIKQLENASARFHISKLEALKMKTQATVEQLYGQTAKGANSLFAKIYKDSYYHTAFTLQEGFGVGWDIAGLNPRQIESVLSKPWTLDKQTFSDRIWKQKASLLSEVQTQLAQNMILGRPPDEAIRAIAKKFNTSKSNAGRLVMTESAYFATEAQRKSFEALDVEAFEIVATLDMFTSKICQDMDGKHFPMSQFEAGVTAPPFHPWCRSAVAPYFDDENDYEGERAARGADGQTYYVPKDMTYKDWKKSFVDGGDKSGLKDVQDGGILKSRGDGGMLWVKSGGLRNEQSLTSSQLQQVTEFAIELGMPADRIYYVDYDCTGYGATFDLLRIGTDVYPAGTKSRNPNSNVSARAAIAHEIVGHRDAASKNWTQPDEVLEEVQASIRAARFTQNLDLSERIILLRDAIHRLKKNNRKLKDVKHMLNIQRR